MCSNKLDGRVVEEKSALWAESSKEEDGALTLAE
jgi:hypothetical protein